jgi:hypothetical protein
VDVEVEADRAGSVVEVCAVEVDPAFLNVMVGLGAE